MNAKKWIGLWLLAAASVLLIAADLKISQLPNKNNLGGPERVPFAQANTNGSTTMSNIARWIGESGYIVTNKVFEEYVTNEYVVTNYVTQSYITNLTVITNYTTVDYVTYLFVTNQYVITNTTDVSYITNLYVFTNYVGVGVITNLTVYEPAFPGHNAALSFVWTCTNVTTGEGEWQAVPASAQVWTNDGAIVSMLSPTNRLFIGTNTYGYPENDSQLMFFPNVPDSGYPAVKFRTRGPFVEDVWSVAWEFTVADGTNDYSTGMMVLNNNRQGADVSVLGGSFTVGGVFKSSGLNVLPGVGGSSGCGIGLEAGVNGYYARETALFLDTYGYESGDFQTNYGADIYVRNFSASNIVTGLAVTVDSLESPDDSKPENAVAIFDSRGTGFPLLIARTNNNEHVFELDGLGVLNGNGAGLSNVVGFGEINNFFTTNLYVQNVFVESNLYVTNIIIANKAYITNVIVQDIWRTNRTVTLATNATSATLDFLSDKDWVEVPNLLVTNLTLSPTNLIAGREMWVFLTAANNDYDVVVTNTAGTAIHWNFNSTTNGTTSFKVTNGISAELCLTIHSNNVLNAVYGYYR